MDVDLSEAPGWIVVLRGVCKEILYEATSRLCHPPEGHWDDVSESEGSPALRAEILRPSSALHAGASVGAQNYNNIYYFPARMQRAKGVRGMGK